MSDLFENTTIVIDSPIFNQINEAVIKAFKPLINAKSVSNGSAFVTWFETDDHDITASVTLKSMMDSVDGFDPVYVEGICHLDFGLRNDSNELVWDKLPVNFNYGFYSYNLTWATKDANDLLTHNNGEAFGIDSKTDDELSSWVMGSVMGAQANSDPTYQGFLKAVFDIVKKEQLAV